MRLRLRGEIAATTLAGSNGFEVGASVGRARAAWLATGVSTSTLLAVVGPRELRLLSSSSLRTASWCDAE